MGQARGVITEEELQAYGNANIMLLDGASSSTGSGGGSATGSSNYTWTINWNEDGFTGISFLIGWDWGDMETEFQSMEENGTLEDWLEGRSSADPAVVNAAIESILGSYRFSNAGCIISDRIQ